MPNFNFKSQLPIADIIAAAQRKPQIEAQIAQTQEEARQNRFKTLLDALSTGAQVSRLMSQNKTDAQTQQAQASQMQGQQQVQSILQEPGQAAPVTAPIQQFGPGIGPVGPQGQAPAPVPTGTVTPTFSQTPQGVTQTPRLNAALVKAFPAAAGQHLTDQAFSDPLDRQYKQAQIANIGVDNQIAATKIMDERAKTAQGAAMDQSKLELERQKVAIEREKLKMEALNSGTKLTDQQANGLLFGERAAEAHQQLDELMNSGLDVSSWSVGLQSKLPNIAQPEKVQQLQQAKLNFISAVLRKESGAAISNSEIKNAEKQYFPSAGDTAGVLAQKKKNRDTAIQGLFRSAGKQGEDLLARYRATSGSPHGALPIVGSTFNGGKVLSVEKVQ